MSYVFRLPLIYIPRYSPISNETKEIKLADNPENINIEYQLKM